MRGKGGIDRGIDLIAAGADGRSDGGQDILGAGGKALSTKASTIFAAMPRAVPRQPAWAAPMTRRTRSTKRSGTQSAVLTPRATPGRSVIRPSHSGTHPGGGPSPSRTQDPVAVDLPHQDQPPVRNRKGLADQGQVPADILLPVAREKSRVEAGKRPRAHPAAAGAEGMGHETQRRDAPRLPDIRWRLFVQNGTCDTDTPV